MTEQQRSALFWVILALFVFIVVVSVLVALRIGFFGNATPAFQNVSVGTVIAGIFGAVLTVYKGAFSRGDLFISLDFQDKRAEDVDLVHQGSYEIWDEGRGRVAKQGTILAELGLGGWYCRLPGKIELSDRVGMHFQERGGEEWEVRYFSPRFNRQPVIRR